MKVELDLNKPLQIGKQIKTRHRLDRWIDFKRERLPSFCTDYGRLGHEVKFYDVAK